MRMGQDGDPSMREQQFCAALTTMGNDLRGWGLQVLHQLVEVSAKAATRDAASLTSDLLPTLLEKVRFYRIRGCKGPGIPRQQFAPWLKILLCMNLTGL